MEERERKSGRRVVGLTVTITTKPSVVKFELKGTATLTGKNSAIEKMLETNPKTKVPLVLHKIYQSIFTNTFLLASLLDAPYPPPDLLYFGEMNKP
ncbi:MAG: hypothetical protein JSW53_06230, partial [Candidatus Bathyarchaeota archaeon]